MKVNNAVCIKCVCGKGWKNYNGEIEKIDDNLVKLDYWKERSEEVAPGMREGFFEESKKRVEQIKNEYWVAKARTPEEKRQRREILIPLLEDYMAFLIDSIAHYFPVNSKAFIFFPIHFVPFLKGIIKL